jgi:RNA polymerase sigma factor (sigma-70 family)
MQIHVEHGRHALSLGANYMIVPDLVEECSRAGLHDDAGPGDGITKGLSGSERPRATESCRFLCVCQRAASRSESQKKEREERKRWHGRGNLREPCGVSSERALAHRPAATYPASHLWKTLLGARYLVSSPLARLRSRVSRRGYNSGDKTEIDPLCARQDEVVLLSRDARRAPHRNGVATANEVSGQPGVPPALARLLNATERVDFEEAWAEFIAAHSRILLHTCRQVAHDRDAAMDGYAYVLEALREDCCRRLHAYTPDARSRFTTWLVVVTRRLVLDHHRRRYGRSRSEDDLRRAEQAARRRLEEFIASKVDPDRLTTSAANSPDLVIRRQELANVLRRALEELDPADRLLLTLRFEDDRPVRQIAAMLGLPTVFHVYRRLAAVLEMLKRALARRGVDESEP